MYCGQCGHPTPAGTTFCGSCGQQIAHSAGAIHPEIRPPPPPQLDPLARRAVLDQHVRWAARYGARLESQLDYSVQLVEDHRVNHLLHFFIGLVTFGLWWLVWLILGIFGGEKRTTIFVDEAGCAHYSGALRPPDSSRPW